MIISSNKIQKGTSLTENQAAIWAAQKLYPQSPLYKVNGYLTITGKVDQTLFQKAFNFVVEKSDVLRTVFTECDGVPYQHVLPQLDYQLELLDLSDASNPGRRLQDYIRNRMNKVFEFTGEMFHSKLFRLSAEQYVWYSELHHLICDGYSTQELIRRVAIVYRRLSVADSVGEDFDRSGLLNDLCFSQFETCLRANLGYKKTECYQRDRKYWLRKFLRPVEPLVLAANQQLGCCRSATSQVRKTQVRQMERYLGDVLSANLFSLARDMSGEGETEETAFAVLMTSLMAVFLYRFSGRVDIVLGLAFHNRRTHAEKSALGPFSTVLPLRINVEKVGLEEEGGFSRLFKAVAQEFRHSIRHGRVVANVAPNCDYHAVINYHKNVMGTLFDERGQEMEGFAGLPYKPVWLHPGHDLHPLTVQITDFEGRGELTLKMDCNAALFSESISGRLFRHFNALLENFVSNPERVMEVALVNATERRQLLYKWNGSVKNALQPNTVLQRLQRVVAAHPDAVAVIGSDDENLSLTYRSLNQRASQMAHGLIQRGVGPEVAVAVCIEPSVNYVVALLAVMKAAATYVPLDPQYPKQRLEYICRDCNAALVLVSAATQDRVDAGAGVKINIDDEASTFSSMSTDDPAVEVSPLNTVYVIYTSGTTGMPKGVRVQQRGLVNLIDWHRETFLPQPGARVSQLARPSFDACAWEIWAGLSAAATLYIGTQESRVSAAHLYEFLNHNQINIAFVPTVLMSELLEFDWSGNTALRCLLTGGDRLNVKIPASLPFSVIDNYGPTENTVVTTSGRVTTASDASAAVACIGRPINNVRIYVLDRRLEPVPVGVPGMLYIGGQSLATGYHGRPDLTADNFIPDPFSEIPGARLYCSGDLVRYFEGGALEFLGRADDQVKIRGFRVELNEVATTLNALPDIRQSVVVCRGEEAQRELIAYITPSEHCISHRAKQLEKLESVNITQWKEVYDQVYSDSSAHDEEPGFDISGWNNSYTGESIDPEQMRAWRDATCERIRALRPRNIYEVGCGTGLLLFPLAPYCINYFASDFSFQALHSIEKNLSSIDIHRNKVKLRKCHADDPQYMIASAFDTFVINSVTQYFSSGRYLAKVIDNIAGCAAVEGHIFIGDVRDLRYLKEFHSAVAATAASRGAGPALYAPEFWERIEQSAASEQELLIDPEFFVQLAHTHSRISDVDILLKEGRATNEMNQYRYDVILHLDKMPGQKHALEKWERGLDLEALTSHLLRTIPDCLLVPAVPNYRIDRDLWLAAALQECAQEKGDIESVLARYQSNDQFRAPDEQLSPQDFWDIGRAIGYRVDISNFYSCDRGCYAVLFRRCNTSAAKLPASRFFRTHHSLSPVNSAIAYTNNPLSNLVKEHLVGEIRTHCETQLPTYMVPGRFVILNRLPQTANGKVDKTALPVPQRKHQLKHSNAVAPRTEVEKTLCAIWEEVLQIREVGIDDNFFELGGHSLKATQVIARIRRKFNLELPLRCMFEGEAPTVASLAQRIQTARQAQTAQPVVISQLETQHVEQNMPMSKAAANDSVPLSFAQERLWFLDKLYPGNTLYSMPMAFRIKGQLNCNALEYALAEVIRRHEPLRTVFRTGKTGETAQIVRAVMPFELEICDFSEWKHSVEETLQGSDSSVEQSAGAENYLKALKQIHSLTRQPFNLENGPLLRCCLFILGDNQHVLFINMHHIIADGWSVNVLMRDVTQFYLERTQGRPPLLPDLNLSYRDFSLWQRELLQAEQQRVQLDYWSRQLRGATPLKLPVDAPYPAHPSGRGGVQILDLPEPLSRDLERLSKQYSSTSFMTLLALFCTLMHHYTGQDDICVGTPIAGRNQVELEDLVGFFVNTLVIRADFSCAGTFAELLGQLRKTTLEAFEHQDVPFAKLVAELKPERQSGRTPLFQVMFLMQEEPHFDYIDGLEIEPVLDVSASVAKFDLTLNVVNREQGLRCFLEYNADIFTAGSAKKLLENFSSLAAWVAENVRVPFNRSVLLGVDGSPRENVSPAASQGMKNRVLTLPVSRQQQATAPVDDRVFCQVPDYRQLLQQSNLSSSQAAIWAAQKLYPDSVMFNVVGDILLPTTINPEYFMQAAQELVNSSDILRTTFVEENAVPRQIVAAQKHYTLPFFDFSGQPDPLQSLDEWRREADARVHDLCVQPFYIALIKLSDSRFLYYNNIHHLLSDTATVLEIMDRLQYYYTELEQGRGPAKKVYPQYAQYVEAERNYLNSSGYQRDRDFWLDKLRGVDGVNCFYARRRKTQGSATRPLKRRLNKAVFRQFYRTLNQNGNRLRTEHESNFMLFSALMISYLSKVTHREDICLGVIFHNRRSRDDKTTMGLYMRVLPLRVRVEPGDSLQTLFGKVGWELRLLIRHGRYLPKNPGNAPLYDVVLNYQTAEFNTFNGVPMELNYRSLGASMNALYVSVNDWSRSTEMELEIEFHKDIFSEKESQLMLEHVTRTLHMLTRAPDMPVADLNFITTRERRYIDRTLTRGKSIALLKGSGGTVVNRFEKFARHYPLEVALVMGAETLSYKELNQRANRFAHYLLERGVGTEDIIGLCLERGFELIACIWGVLKAGAAYAPLDPAFPDQHIAAICQSAAFRLVITKEAYVGKFSDQKAPRLDSRPICLDKMHHHLRTRSAHEPEIDIDLRSPAYVLHTSGSTGLPKGVVVTHENLLNAFFGWQQTYCLKDLKVFLQTANASFDVFSGDLIRSLCSGGRLIICPRDNLLDSAALYNLIANSRVEYAELVPGVARNLIEYMRGNNLRLEIVKYLVLGADALYPGDTRELQQHCAPGTRIFNTYGITEATIDSTCYKITGPVSDEWEMVPIGRPFPGVETYILDGNLQPVSPGVSGELYIGGHSLARGYLNRADLTAERYIPNPFSHEPGARLYKTGDRATWLADGNIQFQGRMDLQVKVRGFRIETSAVEAALCRHQAIREAVVILGADAVGEKRLLAYCEAVKGAVLSEKELWMSVKTRLPEYMLPAEIFLVESLPRGASGKVDRQRLAQWKATASPLTSAVSSTEPAHLMGTVYAKTPANTATEKMLLPLWRDVLGVDNIGIHDNFFSLGGHSLSAMRLFTRLQKKVAVDIPLRTLFEAQTVFELAGVIDSRSRAGKRELWPVRLCDGGSKTPVFLVHPHEGSVMCYRQLAATLGAERAVYGIECSGWEGRGPVLHRIEDMARIYIEQLRSVRKTGPYILGGWSFGGAVAFEMARQLKNQNETIELLFLFDTALHSPRQSRPEIVNGSREALLLFAVELIAGDRAGVMLMQKLFSLPLPQLYKQVQALAERQGYIADNLSANQFQQLANIYQNNASAFLHYRPEKYCQDLLLIRAAAGDRPARRHARQTLLGLTAVGFSATETAALVRDIKLAEADLSAIKNTKTMGWENYTSGVIDIRTSSGDHRSMLSGENAAKAANLVLDKLAVIECEPCLGLAPV